MQALIGQEQLLDTMRSAVLAGRIGHALILSGPEGAGKKTLARWLAQALMCRGGQEVPCGQCPACKKVRSGNHADVKVIAPAKDAKSLVTKDVEALQHEMLHRAYEGGRRVFILEQAHLLPVPAQNKLLKTLEEPPEGVTLLLLADQTAPLLPTVLSRCQRVRLQRVPAAVTEKALRERWGIPPEKAAHAARCCDGWPGAALRLARDEEYWQMRETAAEMLGLAGMPGGTLKIMALAEPYKGKWPRLVELWQGLLRDAALGDALGDARMHPDMAGKLQALGRRLSPERLEAMWMACHAAQERLAGNGNSSIVMDWLLSNWEGCE